MWCSFVVTEQNQHAALAVPAASSAVRRLRPSNQGPTNRRIKELENQNRQLLQLLGERNLDKSGRPEADSGVPAPRDTERPSATDVGVDEETRAVSLNVQTPPASVVSSKPPDARESPLAEAPQQDHSSYHGPTSVLFDEMPRTLSCTPSEFPSIDTAQAKQALVAETAKQRQLEAVNHAFQRLDFDGVDPELGLELLTIFWTRQLHVGLVVYRTAFMRDMACGGPYFSKLLLNAIYYCSSKHCSSASIRQKTTDQATAGWAFRRRFTELLRDNFDKSQITTIQALLIMASSLFTRCDERSVSWLYAGNAFNMIVDLGLHVQPQPWEKIEVEDFEIRRRVYWGAFVIDKIQCMYQGRHPCLKLSDSNPPLGFMDDFEELEAFNPASFSGPGQQSYSPSYHISTLESLCKLSMIMERIHCKVYAVSRQARASDHLSESGDLQLELETWRQNLPPHLDSLSSKTSIRPLPFNLGMLAIYNVLVILVYRLLLFDSETATSPVGSGALATCWKAADEITNILQIHERIYKLSSETFNLCYAAYIGATIYIHIVAQHGNQFGTEAALRVCLTTLDKHQHFYAAARRAKTIIDKLMDRMNVHPYNTGPFQSQNRPDCDASQVVDALPANSRGSMSPPSQSQAIDVGNFDTGIVTQDLVSFQGFHGSGPVLTRFPLLYDLYHNPIGTELGLSSEQLASFDVQ